MAGASPVQTQEDLIPPAPAAIGYRLAGVFLAPAVAVAAHLVLVGPIGLELHVPESPASDQLQELDLLTTFLFTLGIALAGLVTVILLQRFLGQVGGRRLWIVLALGVLVLSLIPIALLDIPTGVQWGLVALHALVALVLIPTLSSARPAEPLHRGQGQLPPDRHDTEEPESHGGTTDTTTKADQRPQLTTDRPTLTAEPTHATPTGVPAAPGPGRDPVADGHPLSPDHGPAG